MTDYERLQAMREWDKRLDAAWDAMTAAERAGKTTDECAALYDVYLGVLHEYTEWSRANPPRMVRPA